MTRRFQDKAAGPSQRQLRVSELIRHEMATLLQRGDIVDPVLETSVVTVPEVKMSPDLKLATIYVMPLGGGERESVVAALTKHKVEIRKIIARRVNLKFAPDVRFRIDETFDEASRIDRLLQSDKVKRDLGKNAPESDEADDD